MENYRYPVDDSSPGMGTAALVLGICSLVLLITGLAFIPAALGILFALLSRGSGRMKSQPRVGLLLSLIGRVLELALISAGIYLIYSGALDTYIRQFQELYEEYYGDSEDLSELFGSSPTAVLESPCESCSLPMDWEFFEGDLL